MLLLTNPSAIIGLDQFARLDWKTFMPLLTILDVLEEPAWLMFGFAAGVGLLGLLALILLYPISKE
jgi:uncharacterized protein involved in exopolysaccharide biosynthesis